MSDIWLGGRWKKIDRLGQFPASSPPKRYAGTPTRFCGHFTQGTSFAVGVTTLDSKLAWPQLIARYDTNEYGQFLPLNVAGRALVSGTTYSSNKAEPGTIQIEVCGFSPEPGTTFVDGFYDWLAGIVADCNAAGMAIPMHLATFPNGEKVQFRGSSGYGGGSTYPDGTRHRFTTAEWSAAAGYLHHQTAPPPNVHWDQGALDAGKIEAALVAAGGDDMATLAELEARVVALEAYRVQHHNKLTDLEYGGNTGNPAESKMLGVRKDETAIAALEAVPPGPGGTPDYADIAEHMHLEANG